MNAKRISQLASILILFTIALTACAGEQAKLIGSYPAQSEPIPLAVLPRSAPQGSVQFVFQSWITLEVSRVTYTANRVADLVDRHGGYVESSNAWLQDGRTHMTLVLVVPTAGFDDLRADLLDLGALKDEQIASEWVNTPGVRPAHSYISLTLRPRLTSWPELPPAGWDPVRTLRQAWQVFVSIFGFLADVLIWVVVVLGPFVLIVLGLRALWRKAR